jgi:hypothetical protein
LRSGLTCPGRKGRNRLERPGFSASLAAEDSCAARLAEFFPRAIAVRIPVRVSCAEGKTVAGAEHTVIEFGTPQEVLFTSVLPLDFEDRVHLENPDGSLKVEAEIVAMQLHQGKTAVAARFLSNVPNWIIKE